MSVIEQLKPWPVSHGPTVYSREEIAAQIAISVCMKHIDGRYEDKSMIEAEAMREVRMAFGIEPKEPACMCSEL